MHARYIKIYTISEIKLKKGILQSCHFFFFFPYQVKIYIQMTAHIFRLKVNAVSKSIVINLSQVTVILFQARGNILTNV